MSIDAWQWYRSKQRKPNPKTSLSTARDVVSARAKKRNPFQAYVDPSRPTATGSSTYCCAHGRVTFSKCEGGILAASPQAHARMLHTSHGGAGNVTARLAFILKSGAPGQQRVSWNKSLVVRASGGRQYPSSRSNAFANMILNRKSSSGGVGRHPKTRRGRAIWGVYLFRILLRLNPP